MPDDFRSYAQHFPQAYQAATRFASALIQQQKRGGTRIQLATIADTSFHLTAGYVLCNSEHAVIQVYGVPYGSVIAGMRLYCQQIGARNSNKAYLFEAFAPNLSGLGMSGAIQCQQLSANATATGQIASSLPFPSASFYWHFFVYIPVLAPFILCSFQSGPSSTLTLSYLANGTLSLISQDGQGYSTSSPLTPHHVHWIVVQNGIAVDGLSLEVQGTSPAFPSTTNGTFSYLLNAPVGTWISKMGYGLSPISLSSLPEDDSDLPLSNALALYPCTSDLSNTVDGSFLTLSAAASHIVLGPY